MKIVEAGFKIINSEVFKGMLQQIEKIGRVCYKREELITEESAPKFVEMLIKRGHEAMIEHGGQISILFTNDRGVTHEEVRHRIASFAQESTRYCNYGKGKFGNEVTFINISEGIKRDSIMQKLPMETIGDIFDEWWGACLDAEKHYLKMLELGASPQLARSVLNNSTKSDIVISANPREWRKIMQLRTENVAHPQMREVMQPLLDEFKQLVPVLFDDISY